MVFICLRLADTLCICLEINRGARFLTLLVENQNAMIALYRGSLENKGESHSPYREAILDLTWDAFIDRKQFSKVLLQSCLASSIGYLNARAYLVL